MVGTFGNAAAACAAPSQARNPSRSKSARRASEIAMRAMRSSSPWLKGAGDSRFFASSADRILRLAGHRQPRVPRQELQQIGRCAPRCASSPSRHRIRACRARRANRRARRPAVSRTRRRTGMAPRCRARQSPTASARRTTASRTPSVPIAPMPLRRFPSSVSVIGRRSSGPEQLLLVDPGRQDREGEIVAQFRIGGAQAAEQLRRQLPGGHAGRHLEFRLGDAPPVRLVVDRGRL